MSQTQPLTLIDPVGEFRPRPDCRPRMPAPLPVRLVTIDDATMSAPAGAEVHLDKFYVDLLGFERDRRFEHDLIYRAENFDLRFGVLEPPIFRDALRPLGIEVQSLSEIELKLIDRQVEFTRQKSLMPGLDTLLLLDPAGNWVELCETRPL